MFKVKHHKEAGVWSVQIGDTIREFGKTFKKSVYLNIENLKVVKREDEIIPWDQNYSDIRPEDIEEEQGYSLHVAPEQAGKLVAYVTELRDQIDEQRSGCNHQWGNFQQNNDWGGLHSGIYHKCKKCGYKEFVSTTAWLPQYATNDSSKEIFIANSPIPLTDKQIEEYGVTKGEILSSNNVCHDSPYGGDTILVEKSKKINKESKYGIIQNTIKQYFYVVTNSKKEIVSIESKQ